MLIADIPDTCAGVTVDTGVPVPELPPVLVPVLPPVLPEGLPTLPPGGPGIPCIPFSPTIPLAPLVPVGPKTNKPSCKSCYVGTVMFHRPPYETLTLCAVTKPLRGFGVGLRSSSLRVEMIEVLLSITSIIATWREEDLRPISKPLSSLLTAHRAFTEVTEAHFFALESSSDIMDFKFRAQISPTAYGEHLSYFGTRYPPWLP